jgi:pyruvate formate lyase activating enzyme
MGLWLEIVTLVVPGFNDSQEELKSMPRFIAGISPNIPWHVTAFHQDYKMVSIQDTATDCLLRAAEAGREAGLKFVYAGNLPGMVGAWEDTCCPGCNTTLVRRRGFRVVENRIAKNLFGSGAFCPDCSASIPGVWT